MGTHKGVNKRLQILFIFTVAKYSDLSLLDLKPLYSVLASSTVHLKMMMI